jgi:diguanylate cyclase (GGDEF)-like protein/PAS domain S-box-containing protein
MIALQPPAAILVVDDNADKRLTITSVLESLGHTIVQVDSGEGALRAVMQQDFAVILLDVQMPLMDGYETAGLIRMRRECEHTPIIFITAHAAEEAKIPVAYANGAMDFIFAPIVPVILRAKVQAFVELFLKARELERSVAELRDSEAQIRSVLEHVADGIITLRQDGEIRSINRAASKMFGYTELEAVGQPFELIVRPRHPADFATPVEAKRWLLTPGGRVAETVGRCKDGTTFPMELDMSVVPLGTGAIHIGCARDISERQTYTEALQHQALHDSLTGLPNRVLFKDRVDFAVRAALRERRSLALLVIDLDDFKHVNDTLGHQYGDELLKLVTQRLVACLRNGDTVARLGGDEFGILPAGDLDVSGAATVVWKIQRALQPTFQVNGHAIEVKASIGVTIAPGHGDNIDDLLRRADLAMYDAKRSGSGFALFAAEQEESPARRLALLADLFRCIGRDELVLHYQPKIDLTTGKTVGVEALIRWNHPSGRLFMPDEFMPEVEHSELMIPVTEWVINEALRQLRLWRDSGYDLSVAVNVGARCLAADTTFFETIDALTDKWGIPAEKITVELTESALIDTTVPGILERLQNMDERLSIDDFGTGYSSLVYLQRLPVVEIKADRSFVKSMCSVKDDAVIVHSIIDLAHNLGASVVAEGVEDKDTIDLLNEHGCDVAQGYYFSRPLPGDDIIPWLDSSEHGATRRLHGPRFTSNGAVRVPADA